MPVEVNQEQGNTMARGVATIVVESVVIIILVVVSGWYLFSRGSNDSDERVAYEAINRYAQELRLDSLDEALHEYFDTFNPDAYHYSQLKNLHDRFAAERSDWNKVSGSSSSVELRRFLDAHPDGFYQSVALGRIDSMAFVEAAELNTREAYEDYLAQFPKGRYVDEAQRGLSGIERGNATEEEADVLLETLNRHFEALAANDKETVVSTLSRNISSYMGKTDPTEEDIRNYMDRIHSHDRHRVFHIVSQTISRVDLADRTVYNIQFAMDEDTYTSVPVDVDADEEGEDVAKPVSVRHFSGTAVLNSEMKITSLVLKQ